MDADAGQTGRRVPLPSRTGAGAALLVAVQLAVLAAVTLPGSFYLDDLTYLTDASDARFDLSYLDGNPGEHFTPGTFVWFWLQAHLFGLDHTVAVVSTLGLQALASLAVYLLLRELFGARPGVLVALGAYLFGPLALPAAAWWIQAVSLLPVHVAVALAALQHVRHVRTGRLRPALLSGLAALGGLLFWEKALLAVVLPVLLTALCFSPGPGVRARLRAFLRPWRSYLSLSLAVLLLAVVYTLEDFQRGHPVPLSTAARFAWDSTSAMLLPSLFGGPWRWTTSQYYGLADPTARSRHLVLAAVAVLVVGTVLRRRGAARGWLLGAAYALASLAPIAAGRLTFGIVVGRDSRYVSDIAVATAVAVGLVLLPLRDEPPTHVRPLWARAAARLPSSPALRPAAVLVLAVAYAVSVGLSVHRFAERWQQNPVGSVLANARHDLAQAHHPLAVYDTDVPSDVLGPLYAPHHRTSVLLRPVARELGLTPEEALAPDDGMHPLSVVRADGHLVPAVLEPLRRSGTGPAGPSCGWPVTPAAPTARIPVGAPVFDVVDRKVRVELLLSAPTRVRVSAGTGTDLRLLTVSAVLPRGPAAVVAGTPGVDISEVVVDGLAPGVSACALSASVGRPVPQEP